MGLTETSLSCWGYGVRGSVMVKAVEGAGLMLLFSLLPCLHHCPAFSVKSASITFSLESHKLSNPYFFHKKTPSIRYSISKMYSVEFHKIREIG